MSANILLVPPVAMSLPGLAMTSHVRFLFGLSSARARSVLRTLADLRQQINSVTEQLVISQKIPGVVLLRKFLRMAEFVPLAEMPPFSNNPFAGDT